MPAPGQVELADARALAHLGAAPAAERVALALDAHGAVGDPGRGHPADDHPADRRVEPVAVVGQRRAARSSARRARRPSCGPPFRASRRARSGAPPLRAGRRRARPGSGLQSLVFGSGARYIQSLGRWNSGSSCDSKRQLPPGGARPAEGPARPDAGRLPDPDPVALARRRVGERLLGGDRAAGAGLEEGEPDRSLGLLVRAACGPCSGSTRRAAPPDGRPSGSSSRSARRTRERPENGPRSGSRRPRWAPAYSTALLETPSVPDNP